MLDGAGRLAPAAVGHGREQRAGVRGDRMAWLAAPYSREESAFVAWLDEIRIACNRELFLGLEDFEGHYAIYPPGARYERHRDRFCDDDARVLSCVLYLNDAWNSRDGGALHLYTPDALDVLPEGGTFVAFLA